jgi:hypothetical protein
MIYKVMALEIQIPKTEVDAHQLHGFPQAWGRTTNNSAEWNSGYTTEYGSEFEPTTIHFRESLADDRTKVDSDPEVAEDASRMLALDEMPVVLRKAVSGYEPGQKDSDARYLYDRLNKKNEDGTHAVSDETFLNVLQWHNYRLSKKQQQYETNEVPALKSRFRSKITEAVQEGWLPPDVSQNLARLDNTRVFIDDGFFSHLDGADASMIRSSDYRYMVNVGPEAKVLSVMHEFTHVVEGHGADAHEIGIERMMGKTKGSQRLREGIVDHVASSLENGSFEVTDSLRNPNENPRSDVHYWRSLFLIDALCNYGLEPIDIRLVIAANLENDASSPDSATSRLQEGLKVSFPDIDIVSRINQCGLEGDVGEEMVALGMKLRTQWYDRYRVTLLETQAAELRKLEESHRQALSAGEHALK